MRGADPALYNRQPYVFDSDRECDRLEFSVQLEADRVYSFQAPSMLTGGKTWTGWWPPVARATGALGAETYDAVRRATPYGAGSSWVPDLSRLAAAQQGADLHRCNVRPGRSNRPKWYARR